MDPIQNCHGCKWLDRYKENGSGYCCKVERSKQGAAHRDWLWEHRGEFALGRKGAPSIKLRRPGMERCELYEEGDFSTRYETGKRKEAQP